MTSRAMFLALAVVGGAAGCAPPTRFGVHTGSKTEAILRGDLADEEDTPAAAALLIGDPDDGVALRWFCSATFIARDTLLTAAHCIPSDFGTDRDVHLYASRDVDLSGFDGSQSLEQQPDDLHPVTFAVAHPDYGSDEGGTRLDRIESDIALVFLAREVEVAPLAVVTADDNRAIAVGDVAHIVGWGLRSVDDDGGRKSAADSFIDGVGEGLLQIGDGGREPTNCYGDSGGPAIIGEGDDARIAGVVSFGANGCVAAAFDTRVGRYLGFLEHAMVDACDRDRRPACDIRGLPDPGAFDVVPEDAGCAAGGSGALPGLGVVVAGLALRRRRRR